MSLPTAAFLALPFQPRFERDELEDRRITIAHLQTIYTEWNTRIPTERAGLKNTYINTILNHPNNQDPAIVANLGGRQISLPPYNKTILKHVPRAQ